MRKAKRKVSATLGGTTKAKNDMAKELEEVKAENQKLKKDLLSSQKLRDPHAVEHYENNFVKSREQRKTVAKERITKAAK